MKTEKEILIQLLKEAQNRLDRTKAMCEELRSVMMRAQREIEDLQQKIKEAK